MTLLSSTNDSRAEVILALENKKQAALANVDIVLSTRIFVSDAVAEMDVRMKWAAFVSDYRTGMLHGDPEGKQTFKNRFQGLRKSIVDVAKRTK
jgi:hypothetical protein